MSEIDDIFSSKGKAKATQPIPSTSTLTDKKKKKSKDKKRKRELESEPVTETKSRPAPETIIDPSTLISSAKRPKVEKTAGAKAKPSVKNPDIAAENRFKDSRGPGLRQFLCIFLYIGDHKSMFSGGKTEEGWSIYKEDELGIRDEGGGKQVCFFFFPLFMLATQTRRCAHSIVNAVSLPRSLGRRTSLKRRQSRFLIPNLFLYFHVQQLRRNPCGKRYRLRGMSVSVSFDPSIGFLGNSTVPLLFRPNFLYT